MQFCEIVEVDFIKSTNYLNWILIVLVVVAVLRSITITSAAPTVSQSIPAQSYRAAVEAMGSIVPIPSNICASSTFLRGCFTEYFDQQMTQRTTNIYNQFSEDDDWWTTSFSSDGYQFSGYSSCDGDGPNNQGVYGTWNWGSCANFYFSGTSPTYPLLYVPVSPTSTTILSGKSITIIAAASGGAGPFVYRWYLSNDVQSTFQSYYANKCYIQPLPSSCGGVISQSQTLTVNPTSSSTYVVFAYDTMQGMTVYNTSQVTVRQPVPLSVSISSSATTLNSGSSAVLTATASGGAGGYTYQWRSGSSTSCASDTNILGISNPQTVYPTSDTYYCVNASDSGTNTTLSSTIGITVIVPPPGIPLSVSIYPTSGSVNAGSGVTLKATAAGGVSPYSYIWFSGASSTCSADTTQVGTSNPITLYPTSDTYYCVKASDSGTNSILSSTAEISVIPLPPGAPLSVSIASSTSSVISGNPVVLIATAAGGVSPYSYTWFSGASSTCSADTTQVGTSNPITLYPTSDTCYCVKASDSGTNSILSSTAEISVTPLPPPGAPLSVSILPKSAAINSGQSVTITAMSSGGVSPYSYVWFSGASSTCSADTTQVDTSNPITVSPTSNTYYCVKASDSGSNSILSSTSNITVVAAPVSPPAPSTPLPAPSGGSGPPPPKTQPILAAVQTNSSCSIAVNMIPDSIEQLTVNGINFNIYDKYTFSGYADILINGSVHAMVPGKTYYLINYTNYAYYSKLNITSIEPENYTSPVLVSSLAICYSSKQQVQPQKPPPVFMPVNLELNINTNDYIINTTTSVSNDTVDILLGRSLVASGKGYTSFNAMWIPAGTYTVEGKDIDSGTFINKTFVKPYFNPGVRFLKTCASNTSASYTCTTVAQISPENGNSVLTGSLYVNGRLVGSTSNTINYTISQNGVYNITFNTTGNKYYAAANVMYSYQNGPGYSYIPALLAVVLASSALVLLLISRRNRDDSEDLA